MKELGQPLVTYSMILDAFQREFPSSVGERGKRISYYSLVLIIIELVDSISEDGPVMPYYM